MRQRTWPLLLVLGVLVGTSVYLLWTADHDTFHLIMGNPGAQAGEDAITGDDFYHWSTTTAFQLVSEDAAANATGEELCRNFPTDRLQHIQPVLKTGHGARDRVRAQLKTSSACLHNLLIFSDLDQVIEGRPIIDTIGDTPRHLIESDDQTLPYRHLKAAMAANGSLTDADMTPSQAWELDKFKFLPDISRAWMMEPERQWYVFFEGDTFMVWDTVFRLLENFDADAPHYFGSPSPGRDGTWFANGGPGFILSRGAMRKLIKNDYDWWTGEYRGSKLSEKHWHETLVNCCGDSITGWALWEARVKLEGLWPMFNPHPPHGVPFSDLYWCQPVLSMHKPTEDDMTTFWRWEWQNRAVDRPLLYRDIATSYNNNFQLDQRTNWDNADWDGFDPPDTYSPHSSASDCHNACTMHERCFQWTYHLHRCYFVHSFRLGRAKQPHLDDSRKAEAEEQGWTVEDQRYTAGWDQVKIQKWIDQRPCEQVQWVKPSTERIF